MQVRPRDLEADQRGHGAPADRAVEQQELHGQKEERRRLGADGETLDRRFGGEEQDARRGPRRQAAPGEPVGAAEGGEKERARAEDRRLVAADPPEAEQAEVEEPLAIDPRRAGGTEREGVGGGDRDAFGNQAARGEMPPCVRVVEAVHLERGDEQERRRDRGSIPPRARQDISPQKRAALVHTILRRSSSGTSAKSVSITRRE